MKLPVEHVRVTEKGKETLMKIKRRTGLEHWNEICRVALCHSLSNPGPPPSLSKTIDSNIDIEWKTFGASLHLELQALIIYRAHKDGINLDDKIALVNYFRIHLERGLAMLQGIKSLSEMTKNISFYICKRSSSSDSQ